MSGKRSEAALTYRAWYATSRWKSRRAQQLRAEPFCGYCLAAGHRVSATVADHIVRHNGDAEMFWNGRLNSLCALHHSASKQREERKGFSTAVGIDGWPLSPAHPSNSGKLPRGWYVSV